MRKALLCLAFLMLGFAGPARGQFCPGVAPWVFTDVPANDQFCGFITRMATTGVTTGCAVIDVNNRRYCPKDFVTREQMAAFLGRLSDDLFPLTCATGQVMKWNGTTWACANDATGAGGGGGTVTSISAGTGLQGSPNPITTTGSLNLAPGYQLPQGCANGQVPKSSGAGGWTCAADAVGGSGTVTSVTAGTGLTGGTITGSGTIAADTTYVQRRVTGTCTVGSSIRAINADGTVACDGGSPAQIVWVAKSGGNYTGVQAALDSITDASPTKRYLVRIAPGVYVGKVTLKSYVDLEGSGQGATVLTSVGTSEGPDVSDSSATLRAGAIVAEVRGLTVEATGPAQFVTGIRTTSSSGDLVLRDLSVNASAGTSWTTGIYNAGGSPTLRDLNLYVSGGPTLGVSGSGIWNETSSPTVTNVNVNANMGTTSVGYGMRNSGSSPTVVGGLFAASGAQSGFGMINLAGSSPRVSGTRFVALGGTATAFGVWNDGVGTNGTYDGIDASGFVAPASGGMKNSSGANVAVRGSRLAGTFSLLSSDAGSRARVATSLLEGSQSELGGAINECAATAIYVVGTGTFINTTC